MHGSWGSSRKAAYALAVLAVVFLMVATGLPLPRTAQAAYEDPPDYVIGLNTPARITKLIYPTIGNPSIVKRGTTLHVEWDPREGTYYRNPSYVPVPTCTNFTATLKSSNGGAGTITRELAVTDARVGQSTKWPTLASNPYPPPGTNAVYNLTVAVPESLPCDLYDLTIGCVIEGKNYEDSQPNAVDVIEEFKTNFNFIQMSDIHVYGPDNTDASIFYKHSRTERGQRQHSYDGGPTGAGYGARYLHKEIMEINRMNPDFVLLTGDYDFGQRYFYKDIGYGGWGTKTQYEFEQEWFYEEISKLEVPAFIVIGNHDGYNYITEQGAAVDQDWLVNWVKLYGPLCFEFEYGPENKFYAVNTMDWASDQRSLTNYLNIILQPVKYLGEALSGGDKWAPGVSAESLALANSYIPRLTGQLGWLRDRLAANQGARTRIMAMHHDPWKDNGSGSMWASGGEDWLSRIVGVLNMGDGEGRQVLIRLAGKYRVAMMLHGHDHSDYVSEGSGNAAFLDWDGGGGRCISANTTSSSFQGDGNSDKYPGYRRVWINNGSVTTAGNQSYNYQEPKYSWPAYKGTNVGGTTNLGGLSTPAVQQAWTATPGPTTEDVTCSLTNNYDKPLDNMYLEFPMKMLSGGYYYQLSNGTWGETFDVSPSVRMNQVYTGTSANQANKNVRVQKSAAPDSTPPTGSVIINDGAASTSSTAVTLTLTASDSESGVGEMKVSNDPNFAGAQWEPYRTTRSWVITGGTESGPRTVYVKFRDRAMPANEVTKSDSIFYEYVVPAGPRVISVTPNSSPLPNPNCQVALVGENTHFVQGTTRVTVFKKDGTGITINGPGGGETTVQDSTHCTASLNIKSTATLGKWDIGVTNGGEVVAPLRKGFTVEGPAVTAVSPVSGRAGQTLQVDITGNERCSFVNGTSQAVFLRDGQPLNEDTELIVNSTTVIDQRHCKANVTIRPWCDPGLLDVAVKEFTKMSVPLEDGFRVTTHNPRILSVSPGAGLRGQRIAAVEIVGSDTSFENKKSTASFGSGITVNSTVVTDPTTAVANITISPSAAFGPRDVTVRTGTEEARINAGFTVEQDAPVVTSINPKRAMDTGPVDVAVSGGNFNTSNATVRLTKASQDDIVATDYTTRKPDKIDCRLNIAGRDAGPWNVVVTNPDGKSAELTGGFTVTWPAPTVSSITPDRSNRGETVPVNLKGTNFRDGATVRLRKAGLSDLAPNADPDVKSDKLIQCTFALPPDMTQGRWDVVVTNRDGSSATLAKAFTVPFPNPPTFESITPASGRSGEIVRATITGTDFYDRVLPMLTSDAGYDTVSGTNVVLASPTELTCDFNLSGARSGYRNVVVMNDDGQDTLRQGDSHFNVRGTDPPRIDSLSPSRGRIGTVVTITGDHFGVSRSDSVVRFGGNKAATNYPSWSDKSIKCKVPAGAATGDVRVTVAGKSSNVRRFTVEGGVTPEPPAPADGPKPVWYLAEGTSDYGFGTYINIENPNESAATALVTYMTKSGTVPREPVRLEPMSQTVINPLDDIGTTDFSTRVECKERKSICVDRRMVWTGPGAASSEGHCSVGVTSPARRWYLAEGSSRWGFETWLLIQNPGKTNATVKVIYMIEGQGPVERTKVVNAGTRASFNMEADIGQADASIMVDSDQPVIPERAMYRYNRREGHNSIGTTTPAKSFYLAEGTTDWGFTTYVLVQNPNNEAATITVTYMTSTGAVPQPAFRMEPNSRKTINVNNVVPKKDLSIKVDGSVPVIAERAMYWGEGTPLGEACHDSIGMSAPHMKFFLPDGETYNNTETWTLVQNPNGQAVDVEIKYLGLNGSAVKTLKARIPANSRKSYNMGDEMPNTRASVVVTSKSPGKPIMVERAIYWNNRGAGTGTIGGYAD